MTKGRLYEHPWSLDRWFSKIIEPVLTLNWGSKKVKELSHRTYPEPPVLCLYFHEFVSLKNFKYPEWEVLWLWTISNTLNQRFLDSENFLNNLEPKVLWLWSFEKTSKLPEVTMETTELWNTSLTSWATCDPCMQAKHYYGFGCGPWAGWMVDMSSLKHWIAIPGFLCLSSESLRHTLR